MYPTHSHTKPVRIKITPLRPLFETKTRGLPEWFNEYVDEIGGGPIHTTKYDSEQERGFRRPQRDLSQQRRGHDPHHDHFRSFSATVFSSTGSGTATISNRRVPLSLTGGADHYRFGSGIQDSYLRGVDKFCFVQSRDRSKGSKEWWKTSTGDYAEKSLKVTQLQVAQAFPACVARQAVAHRVVYTQSPLEAGIDSVCQWCAILFRTAIATAGMAVLGIDYEPGIGTDAAKVVADCIHSSRVKDFGLVLLKKESDFVEDENNNNNDNTDNNFRMDYGRLSEDEVRKLQRKLARLIITYIELLHLLIVRNRTLLLNTIKDRKKTTNEMTSAPMTVGGGGSVGLIAATSNIGSNAVIRGFTRTVSAGPLPSRVVGVDSSTTIGMRRNLSANKNLGTIVAVDGMMNQSDSNGMLLINNNTTHTINNNNFDDQQSYQSTGTVAGVRTDSAIAVQSELQRSLIKLAKDLYPRIHGILQSETPRWLKQCSQDTYFSSGSYQQTKLLISEEISFSSIMETGSGSTNIIGGGIRSDSTVGGGAGGGDHCYIRHRSDSHFSQSDHGYDSPRGGGGGAMGSGGGGGGGDTDSQYGSVMSRGSENFV